MAKPLAGKRAFEAMGRRASSMGLPLNHKRMEQRGWPMWARSAWVRGWIQQPSSRQLTKQIVQGFVDESVLRGVTLCVTVDRFLDSGKEGDRADQA